MAILKIHGYHTDCGECGYSKLGTNSTECPKCSAVFTHVETHYLYKIGRSEKHYTIEEWQKRDK